MKLIAPTAVILSSVQQVRSQQTDEVLIVDKKSQYASSVGQISQGQTVVVVGDAFAAIGGGQPQLNKDGTFSVENPKKKCPDNVPKEEVSAECLNRFGLVFKIPVINNYGCWCYGGASWPGARDLSGFGPVKDVYDDACKAHHMGFDCITLDAEAEGESCIPNETKYSLLVTPLPSGDYTIECADDIETHWCKRRTCLVDIRFIARHWKLEADNIEPDYELYGHPGHHNNVGNFDTKECAVTPTHNGNGGGHRDPIVKVCCGDYPYRIWYNKLNKKGIKCCAYNDQAVINDYGFHLQVGQLYNEMSQTCCADGVTSGSTVC